MSFAAALQQSRYKSTIMIQKILYTILLNAFLLSLADGGNLIEEKGAIKERQRVSNKKGECCVNGDRIFEAARCSLERLVDQHCAESAKMVDKHIVDAQSTRQDETIGENEMFGKRLDYELRKEPRVCASSVTHSAT